MQLPDIDNLVFLGSGGFSSVYLDENTGIVYKFGIFQDNAIHALSILHTHGYAPKIHHYCSITLSKEQVDCLVKKTYGVHTKRTKEHLSFDDIHMLSMEYVMPYAPWSLEPCQARELQLSWDDGNRDSFEDCIRSITNMHIYDVSYRNIGHDASGNIVIYDCCVNENSS